MKNTKCIVCYTQFDEPREGKLYCSETCKQTAYRNKKKESENKDSESDNGKANEVIKPLFTFDIKEFNLFKEVSGLNGTDLEFYCFVRRDLIGIPNINEIVEYYKLRDNVFDFDDKVCSFEYNKFKSLFHGGAFRFINETSGNNTGKN